MSSINRIKVYLETLLKKESTEKEKEVAYKYAIQELDSIDRNLKTALKYITGYNGS